MATNPFRPLRGLRVLDLSRVLAGPFCSMVLADLGADVIKVERPGRGDDTREWGPPFIGDRGGMSAYFASVNRNKRSVAIELAHPEARELMARLIGQSHVVLENFLPASAAKLGLGPDALHAINPKLIVCSISGFGHTGPWRDLPGYDFVVQALSGLMSITGEPEGDPMKVGVALTDVLTGLFAAISVLAALHGAGGWGENRRSLESSSDPSASRCQLDLSLLDCTLASLVNVAQAFLVTNQRPERYGNAHPHIVPYECFATSGGHLVLAIGNDEQWTRFCHAAQQPELALDSRFQTNPLRVRNRSELVATLRPLLASRSSADWSERLSAAQVPHAPVLALDQVFALPQVQERQMVIATPGGLKMVASPIHCTGHPSDPPTAPPRLGEHSEEVLRELGYSIEQIRRLGALGVVST